MSPTNNILEYGHPSGEMLWPAWRGIAVRFAVSVAVLAPLVIWLQIRRFEKEPMEDDGVVWGLTGAAMYAGICCAFFYCWLASRAHMGPGSRREFVWLAGPAYTGTILLIFFLAPPEFAIWSILLWSFFAPGALPFLFSKGRVRTSNSLPNGPTT